MKNMAKTLTDRGSRLVLGLAVWGLTAAAYAAEVHDLSGGPAVNQIDLPPPVTPIAQMQHQLNDMVMIICTIIFIGVFGVMFYSVWAHRKSRGAVAAKWHESTPIEITWTLVPFIIEILMALPTTQAVVAQKDTTSPDLTIKVTGYQWKWGYDYLTGEGEGISFVSTIDQAQRALSTAGTPKGDDYLLKVDHPLVVPVNKKVRIITTASDVIHAWFVPSFGVNQQAIPGFVRDTWFRVEKVGDYYGQCAQLCGKEHAYMPIQVKVLPEDEYKAWVASEKKREAAARGSGGGVASAQPASDSGIASGSDASAGHAQPVAAEQPAEQSHSNRASAGRAGVEG